MCTPIATRHFLRRRESIGSIFGKYTYLCLKLVLVLALIDTESASRIPEATPPRMSRRICGGIDWTQGMQLSVSMGRAIHDTETPIRRSKSEILKAPCRTTRNLLKFYRINEIINEVNKYGIFVQGILNFSEPTALAPSRFRRQKCPLRCDQVSP
jgi:hypothetical protein